MSYSAFAGCPDEARFLQGVTARTERIRRAAEGEPARAFVIAVTRDTSTVRGVLVIAGLDGAVSRREVTGDSCEEVTSALALITALAVNPLAATAPVPPPAAPGPSSSGAAGEGASASPSSDAPSPASATVDRVARPAQPRALQRSLTRQLHPRLRRRREPRPAPPSVRAGRLAEKGSRSRGSFPDGASEEGSSSTRPAWHTVPSSPRFAPRSSPWLRAPPWPAPIGAQLEWFVGRLEACPLRFAWSSEFALSICAALDAGVLRSRGFGLETNGTQVRPWLAPDALGRVAWSPPGAFFIEAGGGLMAPVTRYSFSFQQSGETEALRRIPAVAPTLELDAGYRFQ